MSQARHMACLTDQRDAGDVAERVRNASLWPPYERSVGVQRLASCVIRDSAQIPRTSNPNASAANLSTFHFRVSRYGGISSRRRSHPAVALGIYTAGVDAVFDLSNSCSFQAAEADENEQPGEANSVRR